MYGLGSASVGGSVFIYADDANKSFRLDSSIAGIYSFENVKIYPQCFDLTAMFGTTIADYVYSLETATAGTGVAWLKANFPRIFNAGYIPYNAGELVSVQASAHKMVGFNQWDEEWELGTYNGTTGEKVAYNSCIRSKNAIHCLPSTNYYAPQVTGGFYLFYYDANGNYIGNGLAGGRIFQTPSNAHQIRFRLDAAYGTTYKNDICINLSDPAKTGEYEPYEEHSYPLDDSLELRGLPKLDADNNLVYDGDVYESTGKVTRRYGIVGLGTLNWTRNQSSVSGNYYYVGPAISDMKKQGDNYSLWNNMIISCGYSKVASATIALGTASDKTYGGYDLGTIRIKDDSYTDATTFKSAMSGVYLVYELATPTTESAQPFTNPQVVDASGTEEYVTDSVVPVGHVTKYVENLKAKLESAPASPTEDGDYIVRQTDGVNEYVSLDSAPAITAKADVSELLKAFPVDTASGSIAAFSDGAELPIKSLTVDIEPIQDLHGYDNPWPAGGGKNKFDKTATNTENGYGAAQYIGITGEPTGSANYNVSEYISVSAETVYTLNPTTGSNPSVVFYDSNKQYISGVDYSSVTAFTFTTPANAAYLRASIPVANVDIFQLELGSTATAYAPYSNICPISGHTQAVVTRTGVNVWDGESEDGYYDISNNGVKVSSSLWKRSKNFIPCIPEANYYFMTAYTGSDSFGALIFYDANGNMVSYKTSGIKNSVFATPQNCRYIGFYAKPAWFNANLSINSTSTDTDYHPYSGQSITIAFGQTVYGGTLDVTNGVLTVDRAIWVVDSNSVSAGGYGMPFAVPLPQNVKMTNNTYVLSGTICNQLREVTQSSTWGINGTFSRITGNAGTYFKINNDVTTIESLNEYLALHPMQFCYELATPITVTLTPNELSTLLGANNIWSDAGEVTAEYRADPTLFIQRKIAEALS